MRRALTLLATIVVLFAVACGGPAAPRAETDDVRISKGFGILYLPLYVIEHEKLLEKHARAAGLGDIKTTWLTIDGGNVINDAMLTGRLDIAGIGAPGFITLWAKAKGNPKLEVVALSAMSATSLYLNTNNPRIKTLRDFTANDRIAIPGIKTSLSAVVLQMIVAKEFGPQNFDKLDSLTVGLPHPEALIALTSGRTEVNSHFGSPPFSYLELNDPRVHRVVNSVDALGNITLDLVYAPRRFVEANPKMTAAFIAAMDEASAIIANDRKKTMAIFIAGSPVKVSEPDLERMLQDPDTRFSAVPDGVMRFAAFMHQVGSIKLLPESWKDMFVPLLHDRAGS